jgi:hypothetical protein
MYKKTESDAVIRLEDGARIPCDSRNVDYQEYLRWTNAGGVTIPKDQASHSQLEADFTSAIQQRLDGFARTRNYDSILSACTYASSAIPKFRDEGQACVNLRDATWAAAYAILEQVKAGQRPMPDELADIEADLPALEWPQ